MTPSRKLDFMLPGTKGLSEDDKAYYASLLPDLPPLTKGMTAEAIQQFLAVYRVHPGTNREREPWLLHPFDIDEFKANADRELENYEAQINREIKEGRLTAQQMSASLFPFARGRTLHLDPLSQLPREPIIRYLEILGFTAAGPAAETTASGAESSLIPVIPSAQSHDEGKEESAASPPLKTKRRDDAVRRLMKEMGVFPPPDLDYPGLLDFSSELLLQMIKRIEEGKLNRSLGVWRANLYCTRLRNPAPWPDRDTPPSRDWTLVDPDNIRDRLFRLAKYPADSELSGT